MYQSEISDRKWAVCALLADVGWLSFFAALSLCFGRTPSIVENRMIAALLGVDLLGAVLMLCGIVELIGERLKKATRVLSQRQLTRGFGALTFGGALGALGSLAAAVIALPTGLHGVGYLLVLCGGGGLCGLFSGMILKEYRKVERRSF
jgi:hypothetical protein